MLIDMSDGTKLAKVTEIVEETMRELGYDPTHENAEDIAMSAFDATIRAIGV